ncbi:peptidoglycan-binding domain-containing protein [Streptomyces aidingensis]|uniref:peptidoglycan-binding domain-containing protein n=1 Tax=Streptomyces aidingensis TaxID=910347 RepID=UPI000B892AEB|nr:peptidoglycan-binding domain-containing protein [Streptomyces aidingensis]
MTRPLPRIFVTTDAVADPERTGAATADLELFEHRTDGALVLLDRPPRPAHAAPRSPALIAGVVGGAVAVLAGCTALLVAMLGGATGGGPETEDRGKPTLALPDGGLADPEDEETAPARETTEETAEDSAGPSPAEPAESEPPPSGETAPAPSPDPATTRPGPGPSPGPTPETTPEPAPEPTPETTPEPESTAPAPVLSRGDTGPEVEELQHRLRQIPNIYDGGITGVYDSDTRAAVIKFQNWYGVHGDDKGVYGPRTRARLGEHSTYP